MRMPITPLLAEVGELQANAIGVGEKGRREVQGGLWVQTGGVGILPAEHARRAQHHTKMPVVALG